MSAGRTPGVNPDGGILSNAALLIGARLAEFLAWERYITDRDLVHELHQMRISAKRLRYTLEVFTPFYGEEFSANVARMKTVQELLGSIHDLDVLAPEVAAHLGERLTQMSKYLEQGVYAIDIDSCQSGAKLLKSLKEERDRLWEKFNKEWVKLRQDGVFDELRSLLRQAAATEIHPERP